MNTPLNYFSSFIVLSCLLGFFSVSKKNAPNMQALTCTKHAGCSAMEKEHTFELTPPEDYPKNYFRSPVDFPIKLTGTFGELRSNHFHSGIDIKSNNGKSGAPVFAAADGFIHRVKIQAGGYGNALYIKHPNGYKTVYAHLDEFIPEVAEYVKREQYKRLRFEVDLNPEGNGFKVTKGQMIGRLGNTGSSTGPHLHFEIRKTNGDLPLNPQHFGLPIPDDVKPSIRGLKIYFFNENREILSELGFPVEKKSAGTYALKGRDTLRLAGARLGFGVKTYDSMTGFDNDNGAYSVSLTVDGVENFKIQLDAIDFDITRYLNAHIDYRTKKRGNGYFQRCYVLPGDKFNQYSLNDDAGYVRINSNEARKINIRSTDADGNASELSFWVILDSNLTPPNANQSYHYLILHDQDNVVQSPDLKLSIPKGALYENLYMRYKTSSDNSHGSYSSVHHLHDEPLPVHKSYSISLADNGRIPVELRNKAVVALCEAGERPVNCGGTYKDGWVSTKVRMLGDFCLLMDLDAPTIQPLNFKSDMQGERFMSFKITDNFGVDGLASGLKYRATVDGNWVLMEYDAKNNRLEHRFDERISAGNHVLRLEVTDDRDNTAVFERTFVR